MTKEGLGASAFLYLTPILCSDMPADINGKSHPNAPTANPVEGVILLFSVASIVNHK